MILGRETIVFNGVLWEDSHSLGERCKGRERGTAMPIVICEGSLFMGYQN